MKKLMKIFLSFWLFFSFAFAAQNLVSNRTHFYFLNSDGQKVTWNDINDGKFTLLWFYDDYCPFTIKSLPELSKFLAYINYYYPNSVQFIFVEALNRSWEDIHYFQDKFHFENYQFLKSPSMAMNEYFNVNRTPTLIILDPRGNIVDKIVGKTLAIIYIRHLDYILGRYWLAHNTNINLAHKLVNEKPDFIFHRMAVAFQNTWQ